MNLLFFKILILIRLTLQAWDHNLYKWNTALATVTLDLGRLAMNAQEREDREEPTAFHAALHGPIPPVQNAVLEAIEGLSGEFADCMADLCMKEGSRRRDTDVGVDKVWLPLRYIEQHTQSDGAMQCSIELLPASCEALVHNPTPP